MVTNHGITRAPVFKLKNIYQSQSVITYCHQNHQQLNQIAQSTSQHIQLLKVHHQQIDQQLYLRFHFDTDQAMGMNMATIAAQKISHHLMHTFADLELISLSSNFCTDKKTINHKFHPWQRQTSNMPSEHN